MLTLGAGGSDVSGFRSEWRGTRGAALWTCLRREDFRVRLREVEAQEPFAGNVLLAHLGGGEIPAAGSLQRRVGEESAGRGSQLRAGYAAGGVDVNFNNDSHRAANRASRPLGHFGQNLIQDLALRHIACGRYDIGRFGERSSGRSGGSGGRLVLLDELPVSRGLQQILRRLLRRLQSRAFRGSRRRPVGRRSDWFLRLRLRFGWSGWLDLRWSERSRRFHRVLAGCCGSCGLHIRLAVAESGDSQHSTERQSDQDRYDDVIRPAWRAFSRDRLILQRLFFCRG